MTRVYRPLISAKLQTLHPTQLTIGYAEVEEKQRQWNALDKKARKDLLARHWFPCILGPGGRHYVIDHHHLGLALIREGEKVIWLMVLKDLSWLEPGQFWRVMEFHQWVHPYDQDGHRCDYDALPSKLTELVDDPYRSLAGQARAAGAFAKDSLPFSEFLWAEFFRAQIQPDALRRNFGAALKKAIKLARTDDARYLPGWAGSRARAAADES
jgi:hypothetical protein